MTNLFEAIKKIANQNPEGFTVQLPDLNWVISGYISAYKETQNCFGDEGLRKALEHALSHDNIVGGWKNEENKMFYFDSSKTFDSLEEATRFGKENEQIAIFDLNTFREIKL